LQRIRELGMLASVSLNPHTDVALLEPVLKDIHMVLIMTVNPGYGGQEFIEGSYDKIRKLKQMIIDAGASTLIEVDGGVGPHNIDSLIEAGVDVFVVGTTVFRAKDPAKMISELKHR
jgi:ribulose-phosphate 3-epimerase